MKYKLSSFSAILLLIVSVSCNKDGVIEGTSPKAPTIIFDNNTGVYTIRCGEELTIEPTAENAEDATITWTLDNKIVSRELTYSAKWGEVGTFYPELTVVTEYGTAEEEIKIEVVERTPPTISLAIPQKGETTLANTDLNIEPIFKYDDLGEFRVEWIMNNTVVCTERNYTFNESEIGEYLITINASNIDGTTTKEIKIEVVDNMPFDITFPTQSYFQKSTDRYTLINRPLYIRAYTDNVENIKYSWSVDNKSVDCADLTYKFTPTKEGTYTIRITGSTSQTAVTAEVKVHCLAGDESSRMRKANSSSSMAQNRVYEWAAAPGQFINETNIGGMSGSETTLDAANSWAEQRLEKQNFVSLGAFGGYIIVGFDHSIEKNSIGYDFSILANAFKTSNEPGIVWVMQDTNGDGLPNDEWYELKGSETDIAETLQDYAVTYYRPEMPKSDVLWTDSEGNSGSIDWLSSHTQEYYYPAWIEEDYYTLRGTRLSTKNSINPDTGFWDNLAYGWGYADNYGDDIIEGGSTLDGSGQGNGFKISNAIQANGSPINLQYIDFIKVQTGVNNKSGLLNEISTEINGFRDI